MDRDTFILTVYCLVVEHYRAPAALYPIRPGGFAPEVSDEEVITMEICGEYLKHQTDQDLFDYFHAHYRHFFPKLTDRTLFVRQAANLWQVKAALPQRLTHLSGQAADPVQALDTLPVPAAAKLTPLGFARFAAHGFSPFLFQGSKTTARLMAKTRQHLKPLLRFLKSSVLAIKLLLLELLDTP